MSASEQSSLQTSEQPNFLESELAGVTPTPPDGLPIRPCTPQQAHALAELARIRQALAHHRAQLDTHGPEASGLLERVAGLEQQERDAAQTCRNLGIEEEF